MNFSEAINGWLLPLGGIAGAYFLGSIITRAFIYCRMLRALDKIEENTRQRETVEVEKNDGK